MVEGQDVFDRLLYENEDKGYQYRLTLSEFRGVQYLNVRKYFMTYESEYVPSKEGASIPATISNLLALVDGLMELLALEEKQDLVLKHFRDKFPSLQN